MDPRPSFRLSGGDAEPDGMMIIFALSYNMQMATRACCSFGHAVFFGLAGIARPIC